MVGVSFNENIFNKNKFTEFCQKYGFVFPQSVLHYLIQNNDSDLDANIVKMNNNECYVRCFYGTSDNEYSDIEAVYQSYIDRLPSKCVPLADPDYGNQICISLNDENYGKIFFWDHETMDTEKGEDCMLRFEDMELLADSFDEFLDKILPSPYEEIQESYTPLQIKFNRVISWFRTLCGKL